MTVAVATPFSTSHPAARSLRDIVRVLVPGSACIVSLSNRCFATKPVWRWQGIGDEGHVQQVGAHFHYSGTFDPPEWFDLSPAKGRSDPLYVVQSRTPDEDDSESE